MSIDHNDIGKSWVSIWNELDKEVRAARVPEIWAVGASHIAPGFHGDGLTEIKHIGASAMEPP
jgi:hypothetical protein